MRAMSRGDYDGLVAANEPPAPEFSPRRVLKNYGDMTTSEFQSHLIKLDTTFRGDKALNTGKRPPNTEDEFVHLQSRALQLRKQPVANGEPAGVAPSPTSDDRLPRLPSEGCAGCPADLQLQETVFLLAARWGPRPARVGRSLCSTL